MQRDTTIKRYISISERNGYVSIYVFNIHNDVSVNLDELKLNELVVEWGMKISIIESKKR
jgi:hypothetical protein